MYDSATPGLGVSGRLSTFRDEHPETLDDLHALIEVGAQEIARIMGDGKTTQRSKASAVIEAADALVTAGVVTSADLRQKATSPADHPFQRDRHWNPQTHHWDHRTAAGQDHREMRPRRMPPNGAPSCRPIPPYAGASCPTACAMRSGTTKPPRAQR